MRFLLIAYDFPPIPSPQALRWAYLVKALVNAGHVVEVIAPDVPGYGAGGLPELPSEVIVRRVFPGRLTRLLLGRGPKIGGHSAPSVGTSATAADLTGEVLNWKGRLRKSVESSFDDGSGLNWKGRLAEKIKTAVSDRIFPDYRAEWVEFAVMALKASIASAQPDVVVVSHEPACALPVGLAAAEQGLPLVVDLGDPVLAPYTPEKWRKAALALESEACRAAILVSVTTDAAAVLLQQRHSLPDRKVVVIRQGFDPEFQFADGQGVLFDSGMLELLYTGSFYSFRSAKTLLDSVLAVPGVRLSIATIRAPEYLADYVERSHGRIRLLGFLPHTVALAAQRQCDVLVNLANADPVQVPGKIYEYLGAGRPVMHLRGEHRDATGQLVSATRAGWDIASTPEQIKSVLAEAIDIKAQGALLLRAPQRDEVLQYSWPSLAAQWLFEVETALNRQCRSLNTGN